MTPPVKDLGPAHVFSLSSQSGLASHLTLTPQSLLAELGCISQPDRPKRRKGEEERAACSTLHVVDAYYVMLKTKSLSYWPHLKIPPIAWPLSLVELIPQRAQASANCCGQHNSSTQYKDPQSQMSTGVAFKYLFSQIPAIIPRPRRSHKAGPRWDWIQQAAWELF